MVDPPGLEPGIED